MSAPPAGPEDLPRLLVAAEAVCSRKAGEVPISLLAAACGVSERTWRAWSSGESAPKGASADLAAWIVYGFLEYRARWHPWPQVWRRELVAWRKHPVTLSRAALNEADQARVSWQLEQRQLVLVDPYPTVPERWDADRQGTPA